MSNRCDFINRSLSSAVDFIKNATLCEENALRKGFLQSLDPRIKTISFLIFLLTIVSLKGIAFIWCLYALCLFLTCISRIPIGFFLIRTWVFIPLFSLCIAIPALFSFVTPGTAIGSFYFFGSSLVITKQGLDGATLFVARTITSVSFVVLLSLTTKHAAL